MSTLMKVRDGVKRILVLTVALLAALAMAAPVSASNGWEQISFLGSPSDHVECDDAAGATSDFPILIEGDLEGCLYQWFGPGKWYPNNVYVEVGYELFVGCLADGVTCGSFETSYVFRAQYADQNFDGQIWGGCYHPIKDGTGTGDFAGIEGRLDFRDDVVAGNFPGRGLLRMSS